MHDLDRTQLESDYETFESDEFEVGSEHGFEMGQEGAFSEAEEMELAAGLLEATNEADLDELLGLLISRLIKRRRMKAQTGKELGEILRGAARQALPMIGDEMSGSAAGQVFGLELEGLTPEDQEFEVARQFVKFADAAAENAAAAPPATPPAEAAKSGAIAAAKQYAPGLIRPAGARPPIAGRGRAGRWVRRGNTIVLFGA